MILYENTVSNFIDAMKNRKLIDFITDEYYARVSRRVTVSIKNSWKYTLEVLRRLVEAATINRDCGIRIDYVMLEQNNRFEVIFSGEINDSTRVMILELLEWEAIRETDQLDIVEYDYNDNRMLCVHPSYQSISYKEYLKIIDTSFDISSCVYLFECNKNEDSVKVVDSYIDLTKEAPVFFVEEESLVIDKLSLFSNCINGRKVLNLFHERDQLSSEGIDAFLSRFITNQEVVRLTEEQKIIMASILKKSNDGKSSLIAVEGEPGTGKTMLAISCMIELGKQGKRVAYLSRTKVQCEMLKDKLSNYSDVNYDIELIPRFIREYKKNPREYDVIFIDEAQMLVPNICNGLDKNVGLNCIIDAANIIVCVYSLSQMVYGDRFNEDELKKLASSNNMIYEYYSLNRNLRYSGKGSGINWLAHQFQITNTGNYEDWDNDAFEIDIVDKPSELIEKIKEKNVEGKLSRILVKYNKRSELSINSITGEEIYSIPKFEFSIPVCTIANPKVHDWYKDNSLISYAAGPCVVHGLEFDYVGVFIGKEISYDENSGKIVTTCSSNFDDNEEEKVSNVIKVYYALLTRGMNGVFMFIEDDKLKRYLSERLQYASRRFLWIKELASKYNEKDEKEFSKNINDVNTYSYVLKIYDAINDFVRELKQYTEEQLDGEYYRNISDKCSELLISLQDEPMKQEEIKDKYTQIIIKNMGNDAWNKLSECGKKCLISAELTYHDMKDYNQLYDFSAVCVQVSKAVEYELTERIYTLYVEYLKELYNKDNTYKKFLDKLPNVIKAVENKKVRLLKEQEITLGKMPYIIGLNKYGDITDQDAYCRFYDYASKELLCESLDVKSTLTKHIEYIIRIKNDYRNKAAHKDTMDVVSAKACLDYVIEVQRTLGQMLDDYKI